MISSLTMILHRSRFVQIIPRFFGMLMSCVDNSLKLLGPAQGGGEVFSLQGRRHPLGRRHLLPPCHLLFLCRKICWTFVVKTFESSKAIFWPPIIVKYSISQFAVNLLWTLWKYKYKVKTIFAPLYQSNFYCRTNWCQLFDQFVVKTSFYPAADITFWRRLLFVWKHRRQVKIEAKVLKVLLAEEKLFCQRINLLSHLKQGTLLVIWRQQAPRLAVLFVLFEVPPG